MNPESLSEWLTSYAQAWSVRDSLRIASLFSDDAIFQETPFADPLHGRPAIRTFWENAITDQSEVDLGFEVLSVTPNMGIAQWWASYTLISTADVVKVDGIAVIGLSTHNVCTSFHQWWHSVVIPAE